MSQHALKTYLGVLGASALTLITAEAYWYGGAVDVSVLVGTLLFAVVLIVARALPIRVSSQREISAMDVVLTAAVITLGPVWAAIATVPCALFAGKKNPLRTAYEASGNLAEVGVSGMVVATVSPPLLTRAAESGGGTIPPAASLAWAGVAAAFALIVTNQLTDAGLLKVKYGKAFTQTWSEITEPYLASHVTTVATVGAGVVAFAVYGPIASVVLGVGSVVAQALVYHSRERTREARRLREENVLLKRSFSTSTTALGRMIVWDLGRRDGFAHHHAAATAVYAGDLAMELQYGAEKAKELATAGLLHNVGLSSVSPEAFSAAKPNSLAKEELERHPAFGEEILSSVPGFEEIARWVRWHHERPDGRGYPDRLRGPWIPAETKVLAVAAAYAGMVLDKPAEPARSPMQAREEIACRIDTAFDRETVKAFLRILDTETEGYRAADDPRFVFSIASDSSPSERYSGDAISRQSTDIGPLSSN